MAPRSLRFWWMPEGWRVLVFQGRAEIDEHLAAEVVLRANRGELRRVVLASGATFAGFFPALRQHVDQGRARLDGVVFHHLDEFEGVASDAPGSLAREIRSALFPDDDPRRGRFHAVDARPGADSVAAHESRIAGSDLVFLGVGTNGHLAFNEPGTPLGARTHFASLSPETRDAHASAFQGGPVPARALTAGIQTILGVREIVVAAAGAAKAEPVAAALLGALGPGCPASALRLHDRVTVLLDEAAAAGLPGRAIPPIRIPDMEVRHRTTAGSPASTLLVAPHPDDASISCGGFLASLADGATRHIATFSTGVRAIAGAAPEDARRLREGESEAEARILGASVSFLRARSYESAVFEPADAAALLAVLERCQPSHVLLPAREDPHPTHRLCRLTAEEALRAYWEQRRRPFEVWTFEGPWFQLDRSAINMLVTLDRAAHDRKQAGVRAHRSQVERVPFDAGADALERLRALLFSESHLGGRSERGFDPEARVECYRRVLIG